MVDRDDELPNDAGAASEAFRRRQVRRAIDRAVACCLRAGTSAEFEEALQSLLELARQPGADEYQLQLVAVAILGLEPVEGSIRGGVASVDYVTAVDAEQAELDAWEAVRRGLPTFRGDAKFTTWAFKVSRNCGLAVARKEQRHQDHAAPIEAVVDAPGRVGGLTQSYLTVDRAQREQLLLGESERDRQIWYLKEVVGMTYREIAETLDIPEGTIKTVVRRIRGMLRDLNRADPRGREK